MSLIGRRCARLLRLTLLVALPACDNTFDPIDPGGPPFSIFGYLDPSADTQWIRIEPLRTVLRASPDPTGIRATLERPGSGAVIELHESTLRWGTMTGSDSVYAHDFWTTARIEPGAGYRFRALRPDGTVAESVVRIPSDYDVEFWVRPRFGFSYVHAERVKQVAFVFWHTNYYDQCQISRSFRKVQPILPDSGSRTWTIPRLDTAGALPRCGTWVRITRVDVEVVGSEAPWPYDQDYSTWRLAPDSAASNVTGALGFLGGVLTKWTRAEDCTIPAPPSSDLYCKLRYDSTTATLRGTLAIPCPLRPDSVDITLRELSAPPGELPRTRFGRLDLGGQYDIGALRPGIPHQLTISVPDTTGRYHPAPPYRIIYDTLRFTAGQVTTHQATLEHIGPCPAL